MEFKEVTHTALAKNLALASGDEEAITVPVTRLH